MKKYFTIITIFCVMTLFSGCSSENNKKSLSDAEKIEQIETIIKNSPDKNLYKILKGKNPTNSDIKIKFSNLKKVCEQINPSDDECERYESLVLRDVNNKIFILINRTNQDATVEALSALVAGRLANTGEGISKNKEIYAIMTEACFWNYLTEKNNKILKAEHPLTVRERSLQKLLKKGKFSDKYIKRYVLNNAYNNHPLTSEGFSDEELDEKIKHLEKIYNLEKE